MNNKLYVTDFGLAGEYMNEMGHHIIESKNQALQGTFRYASHWTHEGISQSRRDDMEMIAYTILQLLGPNPRDDIWSSLKLS